MGRDRLQGSWERIDQIFDEALDLSADERTAFLAKACPDESTRKEVERLLAFADHPSDRIKPGGACSGELAVEIVEELAGGDAEREAPSIPGYRLTHSLGEGGMGQVWEAEQLGGLQRRVAIKVIQPGLREDSVRRFELERRVLARLTEPTIARVYEGGVTASGSPYFAMERVDGPPLTTYCEEQRLDVEPRIRLFLELCRGVQHAHQKAVVHRDLKPSNVLVSTEDGTAVPKIIDFGIARWTSETVEGGLTGQEQRVGTPEYMSPEQVDTSMGEVDTRTDVYGLGVLLYELLTGERPFRDRNDPPSLPELYRRICQETPLAPSARVRAGDSTDDAVFPGDRDRWARRLRGDLDWIALRCLEKEPDRRYHSPQEIADDLRRHLESRPVEASPPSWPYRLSRAFRRHRLVGGAITLAVTATLLGSGAAIWQAVRATAAERAAVREREAAEAVTAFMRQMFTAGDPGRGASKDDTSRELLARGVERLDAELAGRPLHQAEVQLLIGRIYRKLALVDEAEPLLQAALATRTAEFGPDDLRVADTYRELGLLRRAQRRHEDAVSLLRKAHAIADFGRGYGGDNLDFGLDVSIDLANVLIDGSQFDEAVAIAARAAAAAEASFGSANRTTARAWNTQGRAFWARQEFDPAEVFFRRTLAARESIYGDDHPDVAGALSNLALVLDARSPTAEAEAMYRRALQIYSRALGEDHPSTTGVLLNLASHHARSGNFEREGRLKERLLSILERTRGERHPETALVTGTLGLNRYLVGDYLEAASLLDRGRSIEAKLLGSDHPRVAWGWNVRGLVHLRLDEPQAAVSAHTKALEILEQRLGREHPAVAQTLHDLGQAMLSGGDLQGAERSFRRGAAMVEERDPMMRIGLLQGLGVTRFRLGDFTGARDQLVLSRELALEQQVAPRKTLALSRAYGVLEREEGRHASSLEELRLAVQVAQDAFGADHPEVADGLLELARTWARMGDLAQAREALARAERIYRDRLPQGHGVFEQCAQLRAQLS